MTSVVDFLPAAYRVATERKRVRNQRLMLSVPVILALVATDLLFRARLKGIRNMSQLAAEHAELSQRRTLEVQELDRRSTELRSELQQVSGPLARLRMTEVLDDLLADRPAGIRFQELHCRLDAGAEDAGPSIQVVANCRDVADLSSFLAVLRASPLMPQFDCVRADQEQTRGTHGFRLDSAKRDTK